MPWQRRRSFLAPVVLLIAASAVTSAGLAVNYDDPKYVLQQRENPDREEGIEHLQTSGERLTLLSAFIIAQNLTATRPVRVYRLGFPLNEPAAAHLTVRSARTLPGNYVYWMRPLSTKYTAGFNEFAWDANLANEVGLTERELGAVALLEGQGHRLLAPLLLHTDRFPGWIQTLEIRFVFVPNETMEVEYRLVSMADPSHVFLRGTKTPWLKDVSKSIRWDGADNLMNPPRRLAPNGSYILYLTATVVERGARARIPFDFEFNYQRDIDTRRRSR